MPVIGRGRGKFATSKSKLFGQAAAPSPVPAASAQQQPASNGGGFGGGGFAGNNTGGWGGGSTTDAWGNTHSSNGNTDRFADSGEEVEVTFKVYNKCLPRIIGRGGSTIQQLQEESSAQINIEKREDDGTATPVVLKGSKLNVDHARKLIDDICEKFGGKYDNGGGASGGGGFGSGGGFGGMAGVGDDGPQEDEDIWIPEDKCGRVIGRGGSKINEIQSDTGANVKVHDRDSAQDGKIMVTLTGSEGQRSKARKIIEELTAGGGGGGGRWERTSDMEEFDMWVETCRIGRVVGKGGCKIKEIQDTFNCRVDISKTETKDDDTLVTLTGLPEKTKEAKEYIDELCERHLKQESFAASGAGGGDDDWDVPAPSGGGGSFGNSNGGGGGDSWPAANDSPAAAGDGWGPAPTGGDSGGGDAGGWGPGW